MARKRRVFGPLLYGTLIFGACVVVYVGMLRYRVWHNRRPKSDRPGPAAVVAALVPAIAAGDSAHCLEAIEALKRALHELGARGPAFDRALTALRKALDDPGAMVRVAAAEALEGLGPAARPAAGDLIEMLKDDDREARTAAACALLRIGNEFRAPAIDALAAVVAGPDPPPDCPSIIEMMSTIGGEPGQKAAARSLAAVMARPRPLNRRTVERCIISLGAGARFLRPEFEALMRSDDAFRRFDAALALAGACSSFPRHYEAARTLMRSSSDEGPTGPQCVAILAGAVIDAGRSLKERRSALVALNWVGERKTNSQGFSRFVFPPRSPVPPALRRCGLELARQLADQDADVRFDAATLLHTINPEQLAGLETPASAGK